MCEYLFEFCVRVFVCVLFCFVLFVFDFVIYPARARSRERKFSSVLLYVHRDHKDGEPRTATSTFTQLLSSRGRNRWVQLLYFLC